MVVVVNVSVTSGLAGGKTWPSGKRTKLSGGRWSPPRLWLPLLLPMDDDMSDEKELHTAKWVGLVSMLRPVRPIRASGRARSSAGNSKSELIFFLIRFW